MDETADGYSASHAEFYDTALVAEDRDDIDYYVERAVDVDGPVLEMACGTGRIYLELLHAGVDADGFDLSTGALDVLRSNADAEGQEPTVWRADMTDFTVDRSYDLVICPFNAIQHLPTVDDQLAAFESVHDALGPGGEFVFDVFVPSFDVICENYGEWETSTREFRGEKHQVRTRTRFVDEVEQQFAVETEATAPNGEIAFSEEFHLKMLPKREGELLARLSPFDDWAVTGDFTEDPIEDGDSVQVWSLRK